MIKFCCKNCGEKFSVPEIHAGKKGKCPKCKSIVIIPKSVRTPQEIELSPLPAGQNHAGNLKAGPKDSPHGLTFLDFPQKDKAQSHPPTQYDTSDRPLEDRKALEEAAKIDQSGPVGKRKLPWIIDIFLYPVSVPGLVTLGIIIGIPLLIDIAAMLFGIFGAFIAIPGFFVRIVIGLYLYWYIAECIRDSAAGGLRAPETLGRAPGLGDMFLQLLKIVGCFAVCLAPLLIYYQQTRKTDVIFWSLFVYAGFFFPMGLLSVVMFDSFSGLNPILILRSIFRIFFPYCAMVVVFLFDTVLFAIIIFAATQSWVLSFLIHCIDLYLTLVGAHLLGRFYWRYQKKLRWDV